MGSTVKNSIEEKIAESQELIRQMYSISQRLSQSATTLKDPRRRGVFNRTSEDLLKVASVEHVKLKVLVAQQIKQEGRRGHYLSEADVKLLDITTDEDNTQ